MGATFAPEELNRYGRQFALPEFGADGQRRLKHARVLIVGAGGLGSPSALYLAAAGVGTLGLVDDDRVDETNLQRQILYSSNDVGRPKTEAGLARLRGINPYIDVVAHPELLSATNAVRLIASYDVVIDGTDNFATRYLVNDACVLQRRPNMYGSVLRFEGQASLFAVPGGPCYRCLHPEPPPDGLIPACADAGVLGVLPGLIGTIQATEAIKWIAQVGSPLVGRLLLYDALKMRFREIALPRDTDCPVCGDRPTIRELVPIESTASSCRPSESPRGTEMTAADLRRWRAEGRAHALIDVREPSEHAERRIDGAVLIPLRTLPFRLSEVPRDRPVVVHCKSGGRSAIAVAMLKLKGIDAHNLSGGIQAWERLSQA